MLQRQPKAKILRFEKERRTIRYKLDPADPERWYIPPERINRCKERLAEILDEEAVKKEILGEEKNIKVEVLKYEQEELFEEEKTS